MLFEPVVASLPSSTITGTSAADVRSTTPGTNALVDTYAAADTITLNNEGDYSLSGWCRPDQLAVSPLRQKQHYRRLK